MRPAGGMVEVGAIEQPAVGRAGRVRVAAFALSLPLAFVVVLAAATRFSLLDHQSLWYDEIVSLTLAKQPFVAMLHDLARTESTPPLYYVLLWGWIRVFGTTADALRSLSACFGVLAVVMLYLAARVRFSRRVALVVGALAATDPMLIWYSQEARAYSLATFFLACSLYFLLRTRAGASSALFGWSAAAVLALASHYYTVFVLGPEAVYLLYAYRRRMRQLLPAMAAPLVVGALLLPLAIHQRDSGHTAFIAGISLPLRIENALNWLLLGAYGISGLRLLPLYLLAALAVAVGYVRWRSRTARVDLTLLAAVTVGAFVLPIVLAPGTFITRNVVVVLPPMLLFAGAALVPDTSRRWGTVVGLVAAGVLLFPTVLTARRIDLQREDWRGMATMIGKPSGSLAVLAYPQWEYIALTHYRPDLRPVDGGTLHIRELVLVGRPQLDTLRLPPGFRLVEDERLGALRIIRLRARTPRRLVVASLHLHPLLRLLRQYRSLANAPGQDATLLIER